MAGEPRCRVRLTNLALNCGPVDEKPPAGQRKNQASSEKFVLIFLKPGFFKTPGISQTFPWKGFTKKTDGPNWVEISMNTY
jgi:hypothetical protein